MKSVGFISKKYCCRWVLTWWLVCWLLFGIPVQIALADPAPDPGTLPTGGAVVAGNAGFNPVNPVQLNITDVTNGTVINWDNFDIGLGATVNFLQVPGGAVLNNVNATDGMATGIWGNLNANGTVFVVNPLGIVFGPSAFINARNFVASSLAIDNTDFVNGNYNFTGGELAGDVINNGRIVTQHMAALIGRNVLNRGIIRAQAPGGHVIMAAGDQVFLGQEGSNVVVEVAMANPDEHLVDNRHDGVGPPTVIDADHVTLAAGDVWSTAITGVETLTVEAQGDAVFTGPIHASAGPGSDAVADVTIHTGGDFTVNHAITAVASGGGGSSAIANIEIDAGGSMHIGDVVQAQANTQCGPGDATASVDIDAYGGVTVGTGGQVVADASIGHFAFGDASASVDIQTCGDVIVNGLIGAYADIDGMIGLRCDPPPSNTDAEVSIRAFGDVIVNQLPEPPDDGQEIALPIDGIPLNGRIEAIARGGNVENSADITILAGSDVIVNDGTGRPLQIAVPLSSEEIRAEASGGHINSAHIGIATREGDVIVGGQIGAHTSFGNNEGSQNISNVEICAAQDVTVTGGLVVYPPEGPPMYSEPGGQIMADAQNGFFNTANVDIYAGRDVTVEGADVVFVEPLPRNGGFSSPGGQILARAQNGFENTADIGIYAGRHVTITDADVIGPGPIVDLKLLVNGGHGGQVLATTQNGVTNSAEVDICAQDDVTVDGTVSAVAIGGCEDSAEVTIAAGDLIDGSGGISAQADVASILLRATDMVNILIGITPAHFNIEPDIEIGPVDCPVCDFEWVDWSWCEECEEPPPEVFAPAAPLYMPEFPRILGCPAEMEAAAAELGITRENIQIAMGHALALNPAMQPCQACRRLLDAAAVLADIDGTRVAAILQIFNTVAPPGVAFTPEVSTSIATAFAENIDDTEMPQYATAMEYIDAFVAYIAAQDELGSPVGDSTAFAVGEYGAPLAGNANIISYIEARLAALGG